MKISKWRDAILFTEDSGDGGGEGGGQGSDDFDKARAMELIEKLRPFEKETLQLRKQLKQFEGKTILDAEQVALWEQYKKLGAVADITAALQERDASKAELTMLKRQQQVRQVAESAGFVPTVLAQLDALETLTYEEKTITGADGKPAQVIMVSGGKATQEMSIQEYADIHWKDFLPALQPGQQQKGVLFAPQSSGTNRTFSTPEEIAKKQRAAKQYNAL